MLRGTLIAITLCALKVSLLWARKAVLRRQLVCGLGLGDCGFHSLRFAFRARVYLGPFQVGSYRYRSLIEGLYTL